MLGTSQEHACNIFATMEALHWRSSGAPVLPRRPKGARTATLQPKGVLLRPQHSASRGGASKIRPTASRQARHLPHYGLANHIDPIRGMGHTTQ
jgi:hypothetical protein